MGQACGKATSVAEVERFRRNRSTGPARPVSGVEQALSELGAGADVSSFVQRLEEIVMANPSIPASMKEAFKPSLEAVLTHSPNPLGLLGNKRPMGGVGLGMTNLSQNISNSGSGHGSAYEVIATAALIARPYVVSGTVKTVTIGAEDQVSFGVRVPGGVGRRSVEADAFIHKPTGAVGVDYKFRVNGSYSGSLGLGSQLGAVMTAIRQGAFKEFHFVTNGTIGPGSKSMIDKADAEIRAHVRAVHRRAATDPDSLTVTEIGFLVVDPSLPVIGYVEHV